MYTVRPVIHGRVCFWYHVKNVLQRTQDKCGNINCLEITYRIDHFCLLIIFMHEIMPRSERSSFMNYFACNRHAKILILSLLRERKNAYSVQKLKVKHKIKLLIFEKTIPCLPSTKQLLNSFTFLLTRTRNSLNSMVPLPSSSNVSNTAYGPIKLIFLFLTVLNTTQDETYY